MSVPANSTVTKLTTQAPDGERLLTKYQASRLQSSNLATKPTRTITRAVAVTLEATAGLIIKREENFVAFKVTAGGFDSAEGFSTFPIEQGQPLFLTGHASADRSGRKRFNFKQVEPRPIAFHDAEALLLRISADHVEKSRAVVGSDFIGKIAKSPTILAAPEFGRYAPSTREKIAVACRDAFLKNKCTPLHMALLRAGAPADAITRILAECPDLYSPYDYVTEGILSFGCADRLAQTPYFEKRAPFERERLDRVKGMLVQQLNNARKGGAGGVFCETLEAGVIKQYAVAAAAVEAAYNGLKGGGAFTSLKPRGSRLALWRNSDLNNEKSIAAIVRQYLKYDGARSDNRFEFWRPRIATAEKSVAIELDAKQAEACLNAATRALSIITGGPGTGKTTLLKVLKAALEQAGRGGAIIGCAFAGRAVRRLQEATGVESSTIHKLLGMREGEKENAVRNLFKLGGVEILIIDEASMIPIGLLSTLLRNASEAGVENIVLVGDGDQLQPIGVGEPFLDLLDWDGAPTARLEHVYRAASGGGIAALCADVRQGSKISPDSAAYLADEVAFEPLVGAGAIEAAVCKKYRALIDAGISADDILVLAPFRKGDCGVPALNTLIRVAMGRAFPSAYPGEPVIVAKNNYDLGVFNGERGIVEGYIGDALSVRFGDRLVKFARARADDDGPATQLQWAYAMTVHKAQGSEAAHVISVIPPGSLWSFGKPHLYTGFSRAKRTLTIIGDVSKIADIVRRGARRRLTALPHFLGGNVESKFAAHDAGARAYSDPLDALDALDAGDLPALDFSKLDAFAAGFEMAMPD